MQFFFPKNPVIFLGIGTERTIFSFLSFLWDTSFVKMKSKEEEKRMDERICALKEQVKKGSVSAAFSLAEAFKWGYYGEPDPRRAARMYRICCRSKNAKVASQGYLNLGILYYYGYLSEEGEGDVKKAYLCFLKSVLAHPNPEALTRLGDMYRYGQHVEKNEGVAMNLYLKANA